MGKTKRMQKLYLFLKSDEFHTVFIIFSLAILGLLLKGCDIIPL